MLPNFERAMAFCLTTVATFFLTACSSVNTDATGDPASNAPQRSQYSARVLEMVAKIDTTVDPGFVYRYEKSRFVPPEGKTLLIVGQDLRAISDYLGAFSRQPTPGGLMSYWGILSMAGVDRMNADDIAKQGGQQNQQKLVDEYPDTVLQSALWMVGMWGVVEKASEGEYDVVIRQFSAWAKGTRRPIYLRIGYEFDGAHNQMEPAAYVKAFRRIVDLIRAEGADNVAFVWHSAGAPTYKGYPLSAWYPGNDYVDWVGISLFGHLYAAELNRELADVFGFAREHRKPVMIAESSPINGIDQDNTDAWDTWFVNLLSLAYRKNVKAISFINSNWPSYPMFVPLKWNDARLQNNPLIARAWFAETGKDRYLKQSTDLFRQLGYSK